MRRLRRLAARGTHTHAVASGAMWIAASLAARVALQAGYFVIVARRLGPDEYGSFASAVAVVWIFSPFVGLGVGSLLVKHLARSTRQFPAMWGAALLRSLLTGAFILVLVAGGTHAMLPDTFPLVLVTVVGVSELLFLRLIDLAAQAFQGAGQMRQMAWLQLVPSLVRLLFAGGLLFGRAPTAEGWAWLYLCATAVSAAIALRSVHRRLGAPLWRATPIFSELREGLQFSASRGAQSVYEESDKAILASLHAPAVVGVYTAAFRVVEASFAPVRAVQFATYGEFFRRGATGMAEVRRYASRLAKPALIYGITVSVLLFAGASLLPRLLGADFASAADVLRWLALVPVLRSLHFPAADALTGGGHQKQRTTIQGIAALLNVGLNLVLIPRYSWAGAVWATLASDAILVGAFWGATLYHARTAGK